MSNEAKNITEVPMDDARCFFFSVWQARNSKNNKIIN